MTPTVHVEIVLKSQHNNSKSTILPVVQKYLEKCKPPANSTIKEFNKDADVALREEVQCIIINCNDSVNFIDFTRASTNWYVYALDPYGPLEQTEDDDEGQISIATHLTLPSADLFNAWESLYYDNNIKENLLKYAQTIMEFSDKGVDNNIVSCNRVILLHGPPGTGKTSLCKALAQKLTIRMQDRYSSGLFIEINSHSLFSKWFSESGKLVTKMFTKIREIVQNPDLLVCVLIDEVESLAHARAQCVSGTEPSDSIRVVNAVLTQIDQLKRFNNVLVFATSNMTEAIDLAFIDRADIKQFLGLPGDKAVYKIYHSCLEELIKTQVINESLFNLKTVEEAANDGSETSQLLLKICVDSAGLSGRSLRKIPFIAHALFLNKSFPSLLEFLAAMKLAVDREHCERKHFESTKKL